jgi:hypothetical protein
MMTFGKPGLLIFSNFNTLKINLKEKRKWRTKSNCKSCGERDDSRVVLKCLNTKCKCMIHIDCAIQKGIIISLDFMSDFYGIGKTEAIPFYCSKHNRVLIEEYRSYIKQLSQCLELTKKTEDEHVIGEHTDIHNNDYNSNEDDEVSDSFSGWNISNLSHPEFNFPTGTDIQTETTIASKQLKEEFYKIEKPKYPEEDDLLLPNDFYLTPEPLCKTINDFNFAFVSKQFYDYYERDMKQIEEGGRSAITISEIKDLKEFFIKAICAYKDYDSELSNFYMKLFDA